MRRTNWVISARRADFNAIAEKFNIDPVTARIITNRGVSGDENIQKYLSGTLDDLYDPTLLKEASLAADILREKICQRKKIRVIGDYDIDGVCAAAILIRVLLQQGACVDYVIPDRVLDGFGLQERFVQDAIKDGVDTILTCDNGINAAEETSLAKKHGLTVIITDHHQTGERLPDADAVVDPSRPDDDYPYAGICGAVVAWKLMQVLTGRDLYEYLDLAAFATVGDVMELQDENRIIVKYGLPLLSRTDKKGLAALIAENRLSGVPLRAHHIGFTLGPCINAGGRIRSAYLSLQLLLTDDPDEAEQLAKELVRLNEVRKEMTEEGLEKAMSLLAGCKETVLVVYLPNCHESLAGIIAGKIRESCCRPALVVTNSNEEGILKGSARSVEGYHIYQALCACDDLLVRYGGHPSAAGFSLRKENLKELSDRLNEQCGLTPAQLEEKTKIDVALPMSYLREELIREFELLAPFGNGNPQPVFGLRNVSLSAGRIAGKDDNTFKCMITDDTGKQKEGIWFGDTHELLLGFWDIWGRVEVGRLMRSHPCSIRADILYRPQINEYRGWKEIQLRIIEFAKAKEA